MAKGKGGGNNYRPIKNPELLGGQKDNLTPEQRVAAGMRPEVKQDKETFVQALDRSRQAQKEGKFKISRDIEERKQQGKGSSTQQSQQKDPQKDREKDIDQDKDF